MEKMGDEASLILNIMKIGKKQFYGRKCLVFSLIKIGKADLRLKLKKYGNEATLIFSSMKIGKANLR